MAPHRPTQEDPGPRAQSCRACGYDLTGIPPDESNRLTCPECGRIAKPPNAPKARRRKAPAPAPQYPSARCENCGYELAGLGDHRPIIHCPECNATFNLIYASKLEPYPGDRTAIRRMIAFTPWGMACFLILAFLVYVGGHGAPKRWAYLAALGVALALALGEAIAQAHRLARTCFGRAEYAGQVLRLAAIGLGLTLAIWLPLVLLVTALALLL